MRFASSRKRASRTARSASVSAASPSRRRRSVGIAGRRTLEDAVELLDLAALDFCESRLDPADCVRLLPFDQLGELTLAAPDPLVELVEGPPPLGREGLELRAAGLDGVLRRAVELVAQPDETCPLLLALRFQPLRVGGDARLGLADHLFLPLRQLPAL